MHLKAALVAMIPTRHPEAATDNGRTQSNRTRKREAIRRRDDQGETVREIARSYNVSHRTISRLTG
jgi:hypothetical protein